MPVIAVSTTIAVPREELWAAVADLASHSEWMADAESIEFLTDRRQGVGTRMKVVTKVGPLRTDDVIEVVDWVDGQRIGVRHAGLITGTGTFDLEGLDAGTTRFTWREHLTFPWYLGGRLTARLAAPVLAAIWRRNLRRLKRHLEPGA